MRSIVKMIFVSLMVVILSSMAYAQSSKNDIECLRGLKGVYVLVENLLSDIEADGLHKADIQTDVEWKLRLAGIKVLAKEEQLEEPGSPYLYINVNSKKLDVGLYAFSISIRLKQKVFLARNLKPNVYFATTWNMDLVGTVGEQKVDNIRNFVKDNVDDFINDYLSVNPK